MVKIYYTNKFVSSYKKLPKNVRLEAIEKEKLFKIDPFDPKIKTHKLTGKQKEYWAFSINPKYRIKFKFLDNKEVVFLIAGTHNIYRR